MAHAHAELTGGLGVAMVTAGPGITNAVTAIANASLARAPRAGDRRLPAAAAGQHGAAAGHPARRHPAPGDPHLAHAARRRPGAARAGRGGGARDRRPGRAGAGLSSRSRPTCCACRCRTRWCWTSGWRPRAPREIAPHPDAVDAAVEALWSARRPLVVTGRGARGASEELVRLLDASGALYLDTQESRGLVPSDHPSFAGAVRAAAMQRGRPRPRRRPQARLPARLRLAGRVPARPLRADRRQRRRAGRQPAGRSRRCWRPRGWRCAPWSRRRATAGPASTRAGPRRCGASSASGPARRPRRGRRCRDGKVHPAAIFDAIAQVAAPDHVGIADGGDILSFARIGLRSRTYMDAGAFGCLGVGVPFAIAAALAFPGRQVIAVNGDGAFGFNAMEVDTAVRHGAKAVFVVANNAAWNIERYDQEVNYGGRVVGTTLRHSDYAALGRALGAHGERVEDAADLPAALERALANAPAVVDVVDLAAGGLVGRAEGAGLRAGLPGADRLGRGGEEAARGVRAATGRSGRKATMAVRDRRSLLKAGAGVLAAGVGVSSWASTTQAQKAIKLKLGNDLPATHPVNVRLKEAVDRIAAETGGRVDDQAVPEQPARLGHRHAVAGPQRRRRVLQPVRPRSSSTLVPGRLDHRRLRLHRTTTRSGRRWTAASAPTSAARSRRRALTPSTRSGTTASARSPPRRARSARRRTSRASRSACRPRRC